MPKKAPPAHPKSDFVSVGTCFKDHKKQEIVVGKALAEGGFGCIYEASVKDGEKKLIVKFEPGSNGPLFVEQNIYTRILSKSMLEQYSKKHHIKFLGLPYLVSNGIYNDSRYIVIPKYDYCLEQMMKKKQLSVNEIKQVVHCLLNALEYLHLNGYAHADIKAGNLMLNSKKNFSEVYLIDFGLTMKADKAVDKENKKRAHSGSPFFTSSDAHRGIGPSYRGDIEIVGHNLLLWLTGSLPWLKLENDLDGIMAAKRKLLTNVEKELEAAGIEKSEKAMVAAFYNEVNSLGVTEIPDFNKLRKAIDDNNEKTKPPKKIGRSDKHNEKVDSESDTEKEVQPKNEKKKTPKKTEKNVKRLKFDSDTDTEIPPKKKPWKSPIIRFYDDEDILVHSEDSEPEIKKESTISEVSKIMPGRSAGTPANSVKKITGTDFDLEDKRNDFETTSPAKEKSEKKLVRKTPKRVKLGPKKFQDGSEEETKASSSRKQKTVEFEHVEKSPRIIPGLKVKAAVPTPRKPKKQFESNEVQKSSKIVPGLKNRQNTSPIKNQKEDSRKEVRIVENVQHNKEKSSEIIPGLTKTPIRKSTKDPGSPGRTPGASFITRSGKIDEDSILVKSNLHSGKITPPSKRYPTDSNSEPRPTKNPIYRNWKIMEESPEKPLLRRSARTFSSTSSDGSSHEDAVNPSENVKLPPNYRCSNVQTFSFSRYSALEPSRHILTSVNENFAAADRTSIPVRRPENRTSVPVERPKNHSPGFDVVPVERPMGCTIC